MKQYYFYSRKDKSQEPISRLIAMSRLAAAERFAIAKGMDLKTFLSIFAVSR